MMRPVNVFKPTHDDWYGSYRLSGFYSGDSDTMLVEVTFCGNITENMPDHAPVWRTCVWGNDDCGMEYDCDNENQAWCMFLEVIGMEHVDRDVLKELGFVSA